MKAPAHSAKKVKRSGGKAKSIYFLQGAFLKWIFSFFTITKSLMVIGAITTLIIFISGHQVLHALINVPIVSVDIEGDFHKVSKEDLQLIIHEASQKGFLGLDLAQLHHDLAAVPWVGWVGVKRIFPNRLKIHIEENALIARWNDDAYVTESMKVIQIKGVPGYNTLPRLIGTDFRHVISVYERINENIPENMKPVREVDVSYIGAVRLRLAQDIDLVMDSDLLSEQLSRWVSVYQNQLIHNVDRLKRVDLRYVNGLSVVFDEKALKNNNKIIIGGRD